MSILEVLFAMYYLTITVLAVLNLYQAALQSSGKTDQRLIATAIAEKQMTRLRVWALDDTNFQDWTPKDGVTQADDEYPDYSVTTDSEPYTQYSPCSALESGWPAAEQRTMTQTLRKVRVTVKWSPNSASNRVSLVSLLPAPPRDLDHVEITPGTVPDPVPKDGSADFRAVGCDAAGQPIPDLFLDWTINPISGNGTLNAARSGANCTFSHHYDVPPATVLYYPPGSTCDVVARAVYRGLEKTQNWTLNLTDQ